MRTPVLAWGADSVARRFLGALLVAACLVAACLAPGADSSAAVTHDAALYPQSSRKPAAHAAPPLRFETLWQTSLPGLHQPAPWEVQDRGHDPRSPIQAAADGSTITVRTRDGTYVLDAATGTIRPAGPAQGAGADSPPSPSETPTAIPSQMAGTEPTPSPVPQPTDSEGSGLARSAAEPTPIAPSVHEPRASAAATANKGSVPSSRTVPRWIKASSDLRKEAANRIEGPEREIAILRPDGTIEDREARNGHLLWRRAAGSRLSLAAATSGPYLLVVPDASRSLNVYRWWDGTPAGVYLLAAPDAYFVAPPVVVGPRIYLTASDPPLSETRVICLRATPVVLPSAPPIPTGKPSSPPASEGSTPAASPQPSSPSTPH